MRGRFGPEIAEVNSCNKGLPAPKYSLSGSFQKERANSWCRPLSLTLFALRPGQASLSSLLRLPQAVLPGVRGQNDILRHHLEPWPF